MKTSLQLFRCLELKIHLRRLFYCTTGKHRGTLQLASVLIPGGRNVGRLETFGVSSAGEMYKTCLSKLNFEVSFIKQS